MHFKGVRLPVICHMERISEVLLGKESKVLGKKIRHEYKAHKIFGFYGLIERLLWYLFLFYSFLLLILE